uniref:Uncharacterized protein n=1 Tax=Physcomitrium patens TaxID=3218 RepID=A0A2K1L0L0_PHYPA|nr:hypothetical protein PHYPA_002359 [Physcomitrium patens]
MQFKKIHVKWKQLGWQTTIKAVFKLAMVSKKNNNEIAAEVDLEFPIHRKVAAQKSRWRLVGSPGRRCSRLRLISGLER